ncbi:MAG: translation initiation factor IF-2 [Candidatus Cloacimonadales bacterium]|nr:translation initiation factor IF-2 [Candidatus Cloacimonadota bacterium]MDX9977316.1 translation initiation factor IF-2 [Candidatus Cloacimonadales bacterium]
MALRVHDFAKELKISSSALMKHLKDMGINVNHHMNYLEDEDLEKIRKKFKTEAENLKRIDNERRRIQEQLREEKSESVKVKQSAPEQIYEQEKAPAPQKFREETRSVERDSSAENQQRDTRYRTDQRRDSKPYTPRDQREPRDNRAPRDSRDSRDTRDSRDSRDSRDTRPPRDSRDTRAPRDTRDSRDTRQPRDSRDTRPPRDARDSRDTRQPRDSRDTRPPRDAQQTADSRGQRSYNYSDRKPRDYKQQGGYKQDQSGDYSQGQKRQDYSNQTRTPRRTDDRDSSYKKPYRPKQQSQDQRSDQDDKRQQYNRQRSESPRSKYSSAPNLKANLESIIPHTLPGEIKQEARSFGKHKKVTIDELGEKSKHLQAKINKSKRLRDQALQVEIDEGLLDKSIKSVLAGSRKKRKHKKEDKKTIQAEQETEISISEFTSVSELAKLMDITPSDIIMKFMEMGKMVSINQRLDRESLELICDEFEFDVSFEDEYGIDIIEDSIEYDDVEELSRPPVVTIMGHVDHGKTSILDYIRNTKVVAGESGGITQHIGAYQVKHNDQKITFLDTPGHEAFTAMRARGADVTDVAIIVVAANDGVKPQTIEAIDHARAAGVTMIIAINKMDLPEANIDRTIANLLEQNVFLEGWGGEVLWTKTSARTGEGIDELLELILLSCEMKELKAKYDIPGKGVVIESRKDTRMGTMATILIQEGTIGKGDNIICGATYGHVRKMINEREQEILQVGPSDICVLFGLNDVPKAGDVLNKVRNERIARQISSERLLIRQEREKYHTTTTLNNLFAKIKENQMTELRLIVKADTDGSVEAICDALQKLSTDEVVIHIIRKSVGGIIEADVNLASASNAIILGFHVRANGKVKKLAEDMDVEIKLYSIIFDAIDDVKSAMSGMLAPEIREKFVGHALIKQTFKVKKLGTIAGCFVEKGSVLKTGLARVFRNDIKVYEGRIESLQHFDNEVNEILSGSECGIRLKNYNDLQENDVIEVYLNEEFQRKI